MQSYFASMAGSGIGTLTTQVGLSNTAYHDAGPGIPVTGPVSVQGVQPQRIRVKLPKSLAAKNQPAPSTDTYPAGPESTAMPSARISLKDLRSSKSSNSQPANLSSSPPSSSPASKPTQSHNDMDPQTMKAQVNDRAVRKIMDLEIANESLLAVNTTLENTIREQALNLEQMRRLVGMLKRKCGADLVPDDLSLDTDCSEYSEELLGSGTDSSLMLSPRSIGGSRMKQFVDQPAQQPFTNSIVDDLSQSPVDEKEIELQFNRVCGTISQLIQDGTRALNIRGPTPREPKQISQPEPITISPPAAEPEPIPLRQTLSPKPVSPPTTTSTSRKPSPLSTSTTPASSKRASGTVSPPRSASNPSSRASTPTPMKRTATTTSTRSTATTPKPPAPRKQSTSSEPSVELIVADTERIYKKARLLMTARHAYSKRALSSAIEQEDRAIEDEMDEQQQTSFSKNGGSTVAIPRSLYGTLVELVEAVHQDLIGSYERKHEGNENSSTGNVRKDGSVGIVAGGFAIGVGTVSGAVMVGGNTKKKTEEPASWTVPDVKRRVASPVPGAKRPPLSSTMGAGGARNLGNGKTLVAQRAVAGARKGLM
ncbi:hypothetical protein CcCBS67573_g07733 [Chytriomyces confervae]|uniref:Uncharacterized protein n=1 Tax=Chytriomyces confervae TaxID=246404 RepID=A0A507ETI1_9FUNG|nr:hypothetical protein CcCBS67573_g07733 [Chytriomyces confervae]